MKDPCNLAKDRRAQELYADLGETEKILIDLGCSSHNAMWESNHQLLFRASLEAGGTR